jgi:hypothetical protein
MKNLFLRILVVTAVLMVPVSCFAGEKYSAVVSDIPSEIRAMMTGRTWHDGCPLGLEKLAYIRLSHWGFDDKPHMGELIVYKPLADEVVEIFRQLYAIRFPIERMRLPERLPKGVSNSEANNTSAFNCRADEQVPARFSSHSYGIAIDINDLYNPAVEGDKVDPEEGRKWLDRSLTHKGMIKEGDKLFTIFTNHGWRWGGFFHEVDYQHFGKVITTHYIAERMRYIPPEMQIQSLGDF